MNHWLDCIQIWYGCSLGISDDLINFCDESIKKKMAAAASLFLDIDGQSLVGWIAFKFGMVVL